MRQQDDWVVVGLDNGGNANNATVVDAAGSFLVDRMVESPSRVLEGPVAAVESLAEALRQVLELTGTEWQRVRAVGLDSPGPASPTGVLSSLGATNFSSEEWHGFDFRGALERRIGIPVVYSNDANAAALYAHTTHFGPEAAERSSVAAIVGTGLGGGVIHAGRVVTGTAGMAGELGHVPIPVADLLPEDQPLPKCNCGQLCDAESVASLTGIQENLLPFWLTRFPDHPLGRLPVVAAAKQVRSLAETGDELAWAVLEQQALALGLLFTIVANIVDPDAYFLGGGLVETTPAVQERFLAAVRRHTRLRREQAARATFHLVPALDMAGARGAALAALTAAAAKL